MITKSDLIDANQLKGIIELARPTTEDYAEAFQKTIQIISEQPHVTYDDSSELLVKDSGYSSNATTIISSLSDICNQTLIALQCKSCGGVIDKDTMACKHCGMTYMLVNSNEINPRLIYPDF